VTGPFREARAGASQQLDLVDAACYSVAPCVEMLVTVPGLGTALVSRRHGNRAQVVHELKRHRW
jgi:hypothetical protein